MNVHSFNQSSSDVFESAEAEDTSQIHIRVQQRNGRQRITTIQGLADDLDLRKIARYLKREFNCNGNIAVDGELGEIILCTSAQT